MELLFSIIAILFGVTIHEFCHAWTAWKLGDPTAKIMGRVSLNPINHLDPFGTLALFLVHFGWGKPVPVNPHNFKYPKRDSAIVSLAGPASNFLTAVVAAVPIKYLAGTAMAATPGYSLLRVLFEISILLFSLNVLPFPPLDGSKIIGVFVPDRYFYRYERYLEEGAKYFMIFVLIDILLLRNLYGQSILITIVGGIADVVRALVSLGT